LFLPEDEFAVLYLTVELLVTFSDHAVDVTSHSCLWTETVGRT